MRIINEEPYRMFAWELLCYIQMLTLVLCAMPFLCCFFAFKLLTVGSLDVNRTLPFAAFCETTHPCTCRAGIDFELFSPLCNSSKVNPFF